MKANSQKQRCLALRLHTTIDLSLVIGYKLFASKAFCKIKLYHNVSHTVLKLSCLFLKFSII